MDHAMREVALMGALIGAGASPTTAIGQVEQAEQTLLGRPGGEAWEYGGGGTMGMPVQYGQPMMPTMPYGMGKGAAMPYGKGAAMPYGKGAAMPYGKGMTAMPYGKGAAMPYGKGAAMPYGMGATPMMTPMPTGWR